MDRPPCDCQPGKATVTRNDSAPLLIAITRYYLNRFSKRRFGIRSFGASLTITGGGDDETRKSMDHLPLRRNLGQIIKPFSEALFLAKQEAIMYGQRPITRRTFIKRASVAAATVAVIATDRGLLGLPGAVAAKPQPPTRNPLYIPPTYSPSGYTLTAAPATVSLGGGRASTPWGH